MPLPQRRAVQILFQRANMMLPARLSSRSPLFTLTLTAGFVLMFVFGLLAWHSPPQGLTFPSHTKLYALLSHTHTHVVPSLIRQAVDT
jgi:hypothetical protein